MGKVGIFWPFIRCAGHAPNPPCNAAELDLHPSLQKVPTFATCLSAKLKSLANLKCGSGALGFPAQSSWEGHILHPRPFTLQKRDSTKWVRRLDEIPPRDPSPRPRPARGAPTGGGDRDQSASDRGRTHHFLSVPKRVWHRLARSAREQLG